MTKSHKPRPPGAPVKPNKAAANASKSPVPSKGKIVHGKKRRWVQPKDKSIPRKNFLKVRDAKARSAFSKLNRKKTEKADNSISDFNTRIAAADSNDEFLEQLLDPFATKAKLRGLVSKTHQQQGREKSRKAWDNNLNNDKAPRGEELGGCVDPSSCCVSFEKERKEELTEGKEAESKEELTEGKEAESKEELTEGKEAESKGAALKDVKGYMPFIKAQKLFELKQKEKELQRAAQQEERKKEIKRKKEKEKFNKFANRNLRARTRKGQIIMKNVVNVLLRKMQRGVYTPQ